MPSLFLKCRACGKGFPSRIGVTEEAIHGVSMNGLTHRCPQCGQEDQYFTADYFVPKATEDAAGAEPESAAESHESSAQVQARKLSGYGVGT